MRLDLLLFQAAEAWLVRGLEHWLDLIRPKKWDRIREDREDQPKPMLISLFCEALWPLRIVCKYGQFDELLKNYPQTWLWPRPVCTFPAFAAGPLKTKGRIKLIKVGLTKVIVK